jgi:hypothetical protein
VAGPARGGWKKGDVLVVFGELFSRGYANGLVDEATAAGLTVVRSTVGRRSPDNALRPLNDEEAAAQQKPFINVPLEAGFDLEVASGGRSPVDQLQGLKMGEWDRAKLDWGQVEEARALGVARFERAVDEYMRELAPLIPRGASVLFAHTMAGGVPRAKIIMPTMNRIFKGIGDRHESSERFAQSEMGRFAEMNFEEVTAHTFARLVSASKGIRERVEADGGHAAYLAYGYHGTEVLVQGRYQWQTYTPYFQAEAKMRLERHAQKAVADGRKACVFNCPEILTNSSSIFLGVEVSLYPLLGALRKEAGHSPRARDILARCAALLRDGVGIDDLLAETDAYMTSPLMREFNVFADWPKHNRKDEMEYMLATSEKLIGMHRDERQLITYVLSEEVFKACGKIMFRESWGPRAPVLWLGHDCLAQAIGNQPLDER